MRMQIAEPNSYRVETSGWDIDENFFVEKTELDWKQNEKTIHLRRPVRKGTLLFVRLMGIVGQEYSVPVAYHAAAVTYRNQRRYYDVSLAQVSPRVPSAHSTEDSVK